MKFGVVVFPGSNCDYDCWWAIKKVTGEKVDFIWHKEENIEEFDCIVLPGGFSYGDYLRAGAIARFSPVMRKVKEFAQKGGLVIGICNGFQILLEAGLLPGAMRKNKNLLFICKYTYIKVENNLTPFTKLFKKGEVAKIPIAHFEGNYYVDEKTLSEMKKNNQIIFRYCNKEGKITEDSNPNGSVEAIAGICNKGKNVLGMMPHPERCSEAILGSEDGKLIWESIKISLAKERAERIK
ncbi:phosphoribosylformylglycinamidine synthase subunit PurQ [Candidatus Aerophobetes bacterium]|uniref:Phosphoribosylformylglycinamidine synthase subunit PurQ n=1 Tax=Aerophobetes bacterium TaxID=2030807 RepID=A0A7V5HXY5_UNCAE|nr:phosphoribosylformylglycinamidine synthase subunit PurQ [Candidatus Aerophobetes bacterium]HHF97983.1 phosphoribosylformylglycinamidine synthase subunit PurQ [Candidatus Aerophobetes bacterium]